MDFGKFLDVVRAMERAKVDYVLVGGVAVNLHGIVRATEYIDFFVRPDPDNVERLKSALRSLYDDSEIEDIRAEDFGVYPTLRYGPPGDDLVIDVLTRLGAAFRRGPRIGRAVDRGRVRQGRDARDAPSDRRGRCRCAHQALRAGRRLMPLQRFRDFDEARRALWVERGDPRLALRIRGLWAFARRLAPGAAPRGVRWFRTPEEANADRAAWIERRVRALRADRSLRRES